MIPAQMLEPGIQIIEPFAGKGDLLKRFAEAEAYDIEPKCDRVIQRDTLTDPPNYDGKWVITNPPYLARNKSKQKDIFGKYNTNDLYKCFIESIIPSPANGGVIIIPAGFFFSPRDLDVLCRSRFLTTYRILKVKYFEEPVFPDTTTTVVAVSFVRADSPASEQFVEWTKMPTGETRTFHISSQNGWIIGGDIYKLAPSLTAVKIRRYVEGAKLAEDEQLTSMTLCALDSGKRIGLEYKPGYTYPAKESSRTYATLCLKGATLSEDQQKELCVKFNAFLETRREETWSLFLPQYREYARKRIPFELAYTIVLHLI